jgi:mannan endo-1,4-beta-mannosidase
MVTHRSIGLVGVFFICIAPMLLVAPIPVAQAAGAGIYWGALIDGKAYGVDNPPWDMRAVDIFEAHVGKKISILRWGQSWMINGALQPFQTDLYEKLRRRGIIPYIDWWSQELGGGTVQPNFQNRDIYGGAYDAYIRQWARAAKAWRHPFFLRLNPEMNGWWYPFGEGKSKDGTIVNGNSPGDYVKMWRHVYGIFKAEGVTNATWLWSVNFMNTSPQYPALSSLYPGDAYVDWTGFSAYNRMDPPLTFEEMITGKGISWLRNVYQEILTVAPTKPMMIAEFGAWEYDNTPQIKANWIRDTFQRQLPVNFPKIKAAVWFNWNDGNPSDTTPIESSSAAQSAFAESIASSYYAGSDFATISQTPIQPLAGIAPSGGGTATLIAVSDTYVDSAAPSSTMGGTNALLFSNGNPIKKSYVRFDLSPLAGKSLTQAQLWVKTGPDIGAGSADSHSVKLVNNNTWDELLMSYNNRIPISSTVLGTVPAKTVQDRWYPVSLALSAVQSKAGGLFSVAIETSGPDGLWLKSRETIRRPYLVIRYS